jgi:hypothetical protein
MLMDMLKEGEVVTIKVKNILWPSRDRYASNVRIPEFHIYTGTIMRDKWSKADEIGIVTDDPGFPLRRIQRQRIVEVNEKAVDHTPIKSERVQITVQGSKGNTYVVTKENGKASCTCSGFLYRKSCRHITEAA